MKKRWWDRNKEMVPMRGSRGWESGGRKPNPWKITKLYIGFLRNTGLEPLENHKDSQSAFDDEATSLRWPSNGLLLGICFWYEPVTTHPPPLSQNSLDPRISLIHWKSE